ncbi:TPA: hypothetical protein N0F65_004327 [Lagenidium giganteum]|uniref:Septum formation inhibitor MinC C-terminal domain-containing protein n=1 Tax=Lagenidium giganteum TaxID=4803 RepID=A0AAV2YJD2_9STRA|nr:TPA: hypothetical protein N0F65_004327 [Lagenidium giganteum]
MQDAAVDDTHAMMEGVDAPASDVGAPATASPPAAVEAAAGPRSSSDSGPAAMESATDSTMNTMTTTMTTASAASASTSVRQSAKMIEAQSVFQRVVKQELQELLGTGMDRNDAVKRLLHRIVQSTDEPTEVEVRRVMKQFQMNYDDAVRALIVKQEIGRLKRKGMDAFAAIEELTRKMQGHDHAEASDDMKNSSDDEEDNHIVSPPHSTGADEKTPTNGNEMTGALEPASDSMDGADSTAHEEQPECLSTSTAGSDGDGVDGQHCGSVGENNAPSDEERRESDDRTSMSLCQRIGNVSISSSLSPSSPQPSDSPRAGRKRREPTRSSSERTFDNDRTGSGSSAVRPSIAPNKKQKVCLEINDGYLSMKSATAVEATTAPNATAWATATAMALWNSGGSLAHGSGVRPGLGDAPWPSTPMPMPTRKHVSIWRTDYNATVARDNAMGWQGLGLVLVLNVCMFVVAFAIFQRYARSTRFSLYNFRSSSILSARKDSAFTLSQWVTLLWRTPIESTDVETQLGPESTFYLLYQLYTARFLAALSAVALCVLLPLYLVVGAAGNQLYVDPAASTVASSLAAATPTPTPTPSPVPSAVSPDGGSGALSERIKWWSFAHATIKTVPNESQYLWVPVVTVYLFTLAFVVLFRKLSNLSRVPSSSSPSSSSDADGQGHGHHHLTGMQPSALSARSLFVDRGLPKTLREERLLYILEQVFPGYVQDVAVVLNLSEFHAFQRKRKEQEAKYEREKLLDERKRNGEAISWSLRLLPGSMKFPYIHRMLRWRNKPFAEREQSIQAKIERLKHAERDSLQRIVQHNHGAGRAFIVFHNPRLRARFVRRVRNRSIMSILSRFPEQALPRLKRYVREIGVTRWHLSAAPEPDDIDWESVSFPFAKRTAVVLLINVVIILLLFLFTSPVAVTSALSSSSSYSNNAAKSLSDLVSSLSDYIETFSPQMAKMMVSYIPTLILVMINAVLLNGLQIAGRIQPIATDSAKERLILRTSAVYLIFNTLFVPSLAFVSIDAVWLYLRNDGQVLDMLGTLFLHNSGIFYVNYVLQRCFLGTAVNLLRVSEYAKFCWEKPRAVTAREHVEAVEAWPFFTGTQTAIQISMLTIVLTFSTVVPLILPCGALYMTMQHAVDKYSLLYVRPRIKGRGSIARTCTHATIISLLIYQAAMSGFFLVRGTKLQSSSVLLLLMVTYILSLWWYIRDKERAYVRTAKGHHSSGGGSRKCHHKHHHHHRRGGKDQSKDPVNEATNDREDEADNDRVPMEETSALLAFPTAHEAENSFKLKEESDHYREPAMRRYARSIHDADGHLDLKHLHLQYGSTWAEDAYFVPLPALCHFRMAIAAMRSKVLVRPLRACYSQEALLRRYEDRAASTAKPSQPQPELVGRWYLLPTLALTRTGVAGANATASTADSERRFLQARGVQTPIVLDMQQVSSDGSPHAQPIKKHELRAEIERLHNAGFVPVGITNASEDIKRMAATLRLPAFISTRAHVEVGAARAEAVSTVDEEHAFVTGTATATVQAPQSSVALNGNDEPPLVIHASVRSGQQVYAQNRSLVVLGSVNSGAEVLADGDIYVMGALKGRALAGIGGIANARIFCQSFDAELISIANHFTTCDDLDQEDQNELRLLKPTSITLEHDQLRFQSAT